jgi:molybdopterin synthase catalytic subunit
MLRMLADLLAITSEPLDPGHLTARVLAAADPGEDPGVGALATFIGTVRRQNHGRVVERLTYEAYQPLAERVFASIAGEVTAEWPGVTIGLHHRVGTLEVGEASVVVVAASPHRAEAFAACRYVIERLKQVAPIWKREEFEGGERWIEGAVADLHDRHARAEARRTCA